MTSGPKPRVGRRRGRPQRFPEDPHPFQAAEVGCEQRVAWLLSCSRSLHDDERLTRRTHFLAGLAEHGVTVDSTRISRWESGRYAVPGHVVTAYESTLGLTPGSLDASVRGVRRAFAADHGPDVRTAARPTERGVDRAHDDQGLDTLLDLVDTGAATGSHWLRIADLLCCERWVYLRADDWAALSERLVRELGSSVGTGYVRRFEAAVALIRHTGAQQHLTRAIGSYVMDPGTQVITPVFNLLAALRDEAADDLLMRMLDSEDPNLRHAACSVVAVKLARGHLEPSRLAPVEAYAARTLTATDSMDAALDAVDLAVHLPPASWDRVETKIRSSRLRSRLARTRDTHDLLPEADSASVIAELTAKVQAGAPSHHPPEPDGMLRRLLHEGLLHAHKARRHQAAVLIAASPYADAAARGCLALTTSNNERVAGRAWALLMRLGDGGVEGHVLERAVCETRPGIRARALVNLGLNAAPLSDEHAWSLVARTGETSRRREVHGTLFALGMSGSPVIDDLASLDSGGYEWFVTGARWWQTNGPAVRDSDVVG